MLSNCAWCGSEFLDRVNFCPDCGNPVDSDAMRHRTASGVDDDRSVGDPEYRWVFLPSLPPGQWGVLAPVLGSMALLPTALLLASLALWLPIALTTVIATLLLAVVQLALVWILALRSWPLQLGLLGLGLPKRRLLIIVGACVATLIASLGFAQIYGMLVSFADLDFLMPPNLSQDLILPGAFAALSVIALGIVTPVAEEIFFRGFLMRGLANRWGIPAAVVVSAIVFAGLHFQPGVILPVFVTGALLGSLYWYTGSIWPCIAVHAGQNLFASVGLILAS